MSSLESAYPDWAMNLAAQRGQAGQIPGWNRASALPSGTGAAAGAQNYPGTVRAAIARAAQATGVDFDYLLAQARLESGLNPNASAATSSARGLYQFTGSTWLNTLDRHGAAYGLAGVAGQDGASRTQLLGLRHDPEISALMAGELANDNRNYLSGALGRDPDNSELYLAHFLGPDAAARFINALATDPSQSAAALLPKAAAANRSIFFDGNGARSVGSVMDLLRGRLAAAMSDSIGGGSGTGFEDMAMAGAATSVAPVETTPLSGGPLAREFQAAARDAASSAPATPGQSSMAETLRDAFGMAEGSEGAIPANVRTAYGRIRAMGL